MHYDPQNGRGNWLQKHRLSGLEGSQSHEPDSLPRGYSASQPPTSNGSHLCSEQHSMRIPGDRPTHHRPGIGISDIPERQSYQDWSCSQLHTGYYSGFPNTRSPEQGASQNQSNQTQATCHQPVSQVTRTLSTLEQRTYQPEGSQAGYIPGAIPYGCEATRLAQHPHQKGETWCVTEAGQEAAVLSRTAPFDGFGERSVQNQCSQDGFNATTKSRTGSSLRGTHQTCSQSCSIQTETLRFTQKATPCEPPKVRKQGMQKPVFQIAFRYTTGQETKHTAAVHAA